jgi:hypothetical protein
MAGTLVVAKLSGGTEDGRCLRANPVTTGSSDVASDIKSFEIPCITRYPGAQAKHEDAGSPQEFVHHNSPNLFLIFLG